MSFCQNLYFILQVAVRLLVARSAKITKIAITKEQLDLFSLKVLATACISVSNASARTAVLIAFGKSNLVIMIMIIRVLAARIWGGGVR